MNTIFKFIDISENDEWARNIKDIITRLHRDDDRFVPFNKVVIIGRDSYDILPIKFVQSTSNLFIFKRSDFTVYSYAECIKIFAYCVNSYYVTHDRSYVQLCNRISSLQSKMSDAPTRIRIIMDIMDTYYMCIMAGKFVDRNRTVNVNRSALDPLVEDIKKSYEEFPYNPFRSIGAACVHAVLVNFFKLDLKIPIPDYQSGKLVLNRVHELAKEGVVSVGPSSTYEFSFKFFNLATTFIYSTISDLKITNTRIIKR